MFSFLRSFNFNFQFGFRPPVLHSAATQSAVTNTGIKDEVDSRYESSDRRTVVSYSKDAYRNNALARSLIDTMVDGVLGHGLMLNVAVSKNKLSALKLNIEEAKIKELTDAIEFEWLDFAKKCDWLNTDDFNSLQHKAFRTLLVDGDVFFFTTEYKGKPKIRLIEGNNIRTPENYSGAALVEDGVELDSFGRPVAYYFEQEARDGLTKTYARLPIYNAMGEKVIHTHSLAYRPGQLRGMPFLTPVFELLVRLSELQKTELNTAQKQAHMTAVFTRTPEGGSFTADPRLSSATSTQPQPKGVETISIANGATYQMLESTHPNKQFDGFFLQLCRTCAAALGLPLEVVLKNYNTNYSASRAANIQAQSQFNAFRKRFVNAFCQPTYQFFFDKAKAKIFAIYEVPHISDAWNETRWTRPRIPHIDPLKEANAINVAIANGTLTYKEVCAEKGIDLQDHLSQLKEETELRDLFLRSSKKSSTKKPPLPTVKGTQTEVGK